MRSISYVRVSTEEQAKHGYSIPAQIEKIEAFCISQGWDKIDDYIDDGYSAKNLERPDMQRLISDAKDNKFDVVVFYKLDRLVRSVRDLDDLLKIFDANNIAIRSVTEQFDTTTAMGRLLITLVAAIAQWERENTGERVSFGIEKKTKMGKWKGGSPPFGYNYINDELIINSDESIVVKKIFEMAKTLGFYTIAKTLTDNTNYQTKKGGDWHVDTIRGIANNPIYAGYLTNNKNIKDYKKPPIQQKLYEGIHPRIIDRDEFWDLQDILDKRRSFGGKRETSNYYFSSILKCARCGSSMSGHKGTNGVKTYRCSGKKAGKQCTSHIITEQYLVAKVLSSLGSVIQGTVETKDISKEKIYELENELKLIKKLLKKQKTMYENDIIDIDELIEKTDELREQEKQLSKELHKYYQAKNSDQEELTYIVENIESLWQSANDYERKEIINRLFTQIVIDTKDEYKRGPGNHREIIIVSAK